MSKVKSYSVKINNAINLANSIVHNLSNDWQVDKVSQNNNNNLGNLETTADYFFFKKQINGKEYSLCMNCSQNELTTSVVKDINNDYDPLPKEEWEIVVRDFVNSNISNHIKVDWIDLNYIQ